ncbi:MAG: hypothetical protein MUE30_12485, partial [Spirosomaceae bacterium]|nr:hypothetical protein [Spirosomataceae bacterium]
MIATFQMDTEELDGQFLKSVKALFGKRNIQISITDMDNTDATTHLFSDPANAAFLEEQIAYVRGGGELVTVDLG